MAVQMSTNWTIYAKRRGAPRKEFVILGVAGAVMQSGSGSFDSAGALMLEVAESPEFFDLILPAYNARDEVQIGFEREATRLLFTGFLLSTGRDPIFRLGEPIKWQFTLRLSEAPARFKRRVKKARRT